MLAPLENAGLKSNTEHNLFYKRISRVHLLKSHGNVNLQR